MNKRAVTFLFLLLNFALYAQTNPKNEKKAASSSATEHLFKKEPNYTSVKPAPSIYLDSIRIFLKDYAVAVHIDSVWQAALTNTDLYPKMRKSILDIPYDDSEVAVSDYQKISTPIVKKRLRLLNQKTPFKVAYHPELERMIKYYLNRDKKAMERLMSLSSYYFPLFEKVLAKHNLPLELKYLPIIESALNPQAKSPVGATGLWQFMFGTARLEGLKISSYVDDRMDPVKSTEAAADYLQKLYDMFGDWNLALAAYNSGPGNVSKAIRRSGGETDYWKLKRYLPRETARYVPAFMAVMYVFNYAKQYGFEPYKPEVVFFQTDTLHVKHTLKFNQIAKVTGIDKDLLSFLNPAYKLKIIPHIKGKIFTVRLPIKEAGLFVANEDEIYQYTQKKLANQTLPRYYEAKERIRYRVRRGDYLGKIAHKFGVSVRRIMHWNHMRSTRLRVGQRLTIYPKRPVALQPEVAQTSQKESKKRNNSKVYVVQKGDSLWSISRKLNGVSISDIKKWNDISGHKLKPGMRLKISKG